MHPIFSIHSRKPPSAVLGRKSSGFSLIEMIVAIVITGILASIAVLFIKTPLQSYQDLSIRTSLTDSAATTLRRMSHDLRNALPNSIRISTIGGVTYLEYLEIRTAGRYLSEPIGGALPPAATCPFGGLGPGFEDTLEVGFSDTCFLTLGNVLNTGSVNAGDGLVIYNLGPGNLDADAYIGSNRANIASIVNTPSPGIQRINFNDFTFPLASPNARFFIVSGPVTYACNPTTGTLSRFNGYAISAAQPTPPPVASALLTGNVSACSFIYEANVIAQRTSIVSLRLELSETPPGGGPVERATLFQQVFINNAA